MRDERVLPWTVTLTKGTPDPELLAQIRELASAANDADGNPPLSEQTLVDLRSAETDPGSLLVFATVAEDESPAASAAKALAGVAVLIRGRDGEPGVLELVVHPAYRSKGVGAALAAAVQEQVGEGSFPAPQAWSHGNHEAAVELAQRFGYRPVRELLRLRLTHGGEAAALPPADLPDGVSLRSFRPGTDEDAWLAANAAAFAHHPEQGGMTRADLQARMAEDWFDPEGFLLAVRDDDGAILGFHWTKVHPGAGGHPPIGEVYVVGVVPAAQGMGLGKTLTVAGIRHLQDAGLQAIMLYVDADNEAAMALYKRLGFVRWDTDVMYAAG
ncbi:mycothiol synthase [Arthrobacter sp. zg-Y820]|uniref:mycothiol synthase n=1 Tax=unclassified Arthrobacter TaxID=235627 RepID=UPI001E2E5AD9|nr:MULTISPECIES: mycothiol synthase [unclassified Arthrobacter]MCC9195756.1 mycothiol synthase [Arthrobacter sp. zg-Y820]MDK1278615.1 mycothiol synthase [Arthrobacter sp. zg.Y820]WIB08954.1 mycothiol synthase [Arthrobacter sp. zg-Y820]